MNILFRTDASSQMGTGHVVRCLTLARQLNQDGNAECVFACRQAAGDMRQFITDSGFSVITLAENDEFNTLESCRDFDWVVIDHYKIDRVWEEKIRRLIPKIMVIDDLADRSHDCDLLLDQNLYSDSQTRYHHLVSEQTQLLMGPQFALLRPEFRALRDRVAPRKELNRVLVFFGGSDPTNETAKVMIGIQQLVSDYLFDVVVGSSNLHKDQIRQLCTSLNSVTFHCQTPDIAELMARADLSIGAGGTTTWERCCMGLPALVAILAENQYGLTNALAATGAIQNLGWARDLKPEDYRLALQKLSLDKTDCLEKMSVKGMELVDGQGVARVAEVILNA